jgi:hypothetical protein
MNNMITVKGGRKMYQKSVEKCTTLDINISPILGVVKNNNEGLVLSDHFNYLLCSHPVSPFFKINQLPRVILSVPVRRIELC